MFSTLVVIVHVLVAAAVIGLVLLQHGKGADAGASFGGGASGTVFGSRGSSNFLSRTTAILAAVFLVTSLMLAYMSGHRTVVKSVLDQVPETVQDSGAPVMDGKAGKTPSDVPSFGDEKPPTPSDADGNK